MHIPFDIPFAVRCHCKTSDRTGTFDLYRQHICVIFHHASHHCSACEQSSESRRCDRTCLMTLASLLCQFCCHCRKCADLCIRRRCSYNIIFHQSFSCSVLFYHYFILFSFCRLLCLFIMNLSLFYYYSFCLFSVFTGDHAYSLAHIVRRLFRIRIVSLYKYKTCTFQKFLYLGKRIPSLIMRLRISPI